MRDQLGQGPGPVGNVVFRLLLHFGKCLATRMIGLEARIPAKVGGAARGADLTWANALEELYLAIVAQCKGAHCVCRFVVESLKTSL